MIAKFRIWLQVCRVSGVKLVRPLFFSFIKSCLVGES